jgi:purine nucleoside permease
MVRETVPIPAAEMCIRLKTSKQIRKKAAMRKSMSHWSRTAFAAGMLALLTVTAQAAAPKLPVRVVVVTTFELGKDMGDTPGEFQAWVERLPLPQTLPFPLGNHLLRYNPEKQVLGIVTGEGSLRGAASIMALGLDERFDLSKAYWLVPAIAGIDPTYASVGSAAWAEWIVDRDLNFEIDAREIPPEWSTGHVPLGRSKPFQPPRPDLERPNGVNGYHLNPGLVEWAYQLTRSVQLDDTPALKGIRAGYARYPNALKPPFVLKGDEVSASDWWLGERMNTLAEQWMTYWSAGKGRAVTTSMEDCGILTSLTALSRTQRVRLDRVLVLRTGSDFTVPAAGQSVTQLLASEAAEDAALSAYVPSLEAAYRVGSKVVNEIAGNWPTYAERTPGAK